MKKVKSIILALGLFTILPACSFAQKTGSAFQKLVWSEEFNYNGLPDTSKWGYDHGNGCPNLCGWGNHELQHYAWDRKENARVEDGHLVIEARKEEMGGMKYTSARMVTKNKGDWKYGRIEVRAQVPKGKGLWPAIWMLPTNWEYGGWPLSGEIDIMENVGYWPDSIMGTVHTNAYNGMLGTQKTKGINIPAPYSAFHVYAIEWTAVEIVFFVDGKEYNRFRNEHKDFATWPFDKAFHLVLNIAVGGDFGGKYGLDESVFPQKMLVDWVRVYQ